MNRSLRLAYCSMLTAFGTALMFLTGLIPLGSYALPALAGIPLISVVIELGCGWAWSVYAAVSLLAFLTAANKEAVLLFILFFGCYPILKSLLERGKRKSLVVLAKLALTNAAFLLDFWAGIAFFGAQYSDFGPWGAAAPWIFLLAVNIFFWVFDYALSLLIISYWRKFHPAVSRWLSGRGSGF